MSIRDAARQGVAAMLLTVGLGTAAMSQDVAADAREFVSEHQRRIQPLQIAVARSWWTANLTGKDEDFAAKEEAENRLNEALADKQRFGQLKQLHAGKIADPVLARTIAVLSLQYLDKQVDRAALVESLCIRFALSRDQVATLIAKIAPLSGDVQGTRVTGVIRLTDDVVTAFVGVPFFLWLLRRQAGRAAP